MENIKIGNQSILKRCIMETITSCTDCFSCKINRSKGYMRCSALQWESGTGNEKFVSLRAKERKKGLIEWRDIFSLARKCPLAERDTPIKSTV